MRERTAPHDRRHLPEAIYAHLDHNLILRAYDRPPSGMQGYLITPRAARRLVAHANRIVWPIDETLDQYWKHGLRLCTALPAAIGIADTFESTIGDRAPRRRPKWRKVQRELINASQALQRRLFNLKHYGFLRGSA